MPCPRCERVDAAPSGPLTLYLWSPLGHSAAKLRRPADEAGASAREMDTMGALALDLCDRSWGALEPLLQGGLSRLEREGIRLIATPRNVAPTLADVGKVATLDQYISRLRSDWLIRRVAENDLSVGFDPVSYADAPSETFAHAAVLSAKDDSGQSAGPTAIFELARDADFLAALDRAARLTAIRRIAEQRVEGPVFVTFAPSAIYDPQYCLRTTVAEAEKCGVAREAIIFSIQSADGGADVDHLENVLRYYVENGFRTAMTLSNRREAPFEMLKRLKPSVLILEAGLIEGGLRDPDREVIARKLIEIAHRLQVETLVQGVDTVDSCDWAYGQGASYVQGAYVAAMAGQRAA